MGLFEGKLILHVAPTVIQRSKESSKNNCLSLLSKSIWIVKQYPCFYLLYNPQQNPECVLR